MAIYDKTYFEQNQQLGDRPAIRWYAKVCNRLIGHAGGNVFEYGCGMGWLMHHLSNQHQVTGYDISEFCLQQARRNAPQANICTDLKQLPLQSFDLIVSLHVLEHVPNPAETISTLTNLLRSNGKLFFVVPAQNGWGHKIKGQEWFAYRDKTHISLLHEAEWRDNVIRAGLQIMTEAGDGLWDSPYVKWLPRWLQLPLFGGPAAIQVYFGRGHLFIPSSWSECLLLVAIKTEES